MTTKIPGVTAFNITIQPESRCVCPHSSDAASPVSTGISQSPATGTMIVWVKVVSGLGCRGRLVRPSSSVTTGSGRAHWQASCSWNPSGFSCSRVPDCSRPATPCRRAKGHLLSWSVGASARPERPAAALLRELSARIIWHRGPERVQRGLVACRDANVTRRSLARYGGHTKHRCSQEHGCS
jgi:hypothetical protein